MQPPTPAQPPATPAPVAVQASAPTAIATPGATIPLQGIPGTPQQLQGLRARRDVLRDQLERATNRREGVVQQLNEGVAADARVGLQQRLTALDERILQLEADQALTERLLSHAPPEVLAQSVERGRDGPPMVSEDDAVAYSMSAFTVGVILTMVVGRLRRRFGKRRAATAAAAAPLAAGDDQRFERLTFAVDAIAEEVERIGEGQRFVTQLLANRGEAARAHAETLPRGDGIRQS
jgi:hypothetical protein